MRTIRYKEIAVDLRRRLGAGEYTAGRLLPSEAELSAAYSASRVTIRKALEELRTEGLVDSRQGFGWFVAEAPVRQPLARLATIEAQLEAEGLRSERRITDFAFVPAPPEVRAVLGVDEVLSVRRVNLADGEPFARVTVWCPERLGRELSLSQVEEQSFYDLLPVRFGGATQTIGADAAGPLDAELLGVPVGSPVLVCRRVTADVAGTPVLIGDYVFPAHRTEFTVELASTEPSIAPGGLRLLEPAPSPDQRGESASR
ncbi:MAG: GntR family transcriptional regulator [Actinobacteria bacterium]|nr:GntR family transcriptional regulator [Actinomycetota bacterium]